MSEAIKRIWLDLGKIYGARKIKMVLASEGIDISVRTVGHYMKEMGI